MSVDMNCERLCYVQCNFCTTILAVNVPSSSSSNMLNMVTVRCGHRANLLSVNMGGLLHSAYLHDFQKQQAMVEAAIKESGSSTTYNRFAPNMQSQHQQPKMPTPIRPPEKRQRVPSAYNRFIKEEIQRIKASTPEITHREVQLRKIGHIFLVFILDSTKQAKI